jgi:hypothetical protein
MDEFCEIDAVAEFYGIEPEDFIGPRFEMEGHPLDRKVRLVLGYEEESGELLLQKPLALCTEPGLEMVKRVGLRINEASVVEVRVRNGNTDPPGLHRLRFVVDSLIVPCAEDFLRESEFIRGRG